MQPTYRDMEAVLQGARRVLLATHENPDGDGLGSMLAFQEYLTAIGIASTAFSTDPVPAMFHFLPGATSFTVGLNNLTMRDHDVVVFFDVSDVNRSRFTDRLKQQKNRTRVISFDHHPTKTILDGVELVDMALVDTKAAATTVLVHEYLSFVKFPITQNIATCLLTGLVTDTGNFSNLATTKEAIRLGADLLRSGAHFGRIITKTFHSRPLGQLKLWGRALERLKEDPETHLVTTALFHKDFAECGMDEEAAEGISNFLNTLEGGKIICVFREKENGEVKASMRTTAPDGNVRDIAEKFGGGGHVKAAGYTVKGKLRERQEKWEVERG